GGERQVMRIPGGVLMDGHQAGHAATLGELTPDEVPGALRRHHGHVDVGRRLDLPEVDREAVPEHDQVAAGDPVAHLVLPYAAVKLVGDEHHHDVAARRGGGGVEDLHAVSSCGLDRARVG